jgi:tetratricopeptide (TPR) repeat protein
LRAATQDVGPVRAADIRRSSSLLARALELDQNSFMAHHGRAWLLVATGDPQEAIVEEEHALALNPSYVATYSTMGIAYLELGSPSAAVAAQKRALQLSPRDRLQYAFYETLGEANFMLRNDAEAIGWFHRSIADSPGYPISHAYLVAELALGGHRKQAREMLARYLSLRDTRARTIARFRELSTSDNAQYLASQERLYRGLREAGLPE